MAYAAHHRLSACPDDRLLAHLRGAQIIEAHCAGIRFKHISGDKRSGEIHRYDITLLVHEPYTVGITVERRAKSILARIRPDERLDVLERFHMKRIGVMIRKIAVVLAVETVIRKLRALKRNGFGDAHAIREIAGDVKSLRV